MGSANQVVDFIQFLDVLHTSVSEKTNRIVAQIGSVVGRTVDGVNAEWWQHIGFKSRPSKPIGGKSSARVVAVRRGAVDAIIATEDDRGLELFGNLADGESCVYAAGDDGKAQARITLKGDGSINIYTTDTNTSDGTSVYLRVAPDELAFVAPWGRIKFDSTGLHITHASSASFDMGGITLPSPFDKIASYIKMQAGTVSTSSSAQSFGVGAPVPLANAPAMQAAIAALQSQINILVTALTSVAAGAAPGGGAGAAAIATMTSALPAPLAAASAASVAAVSSTSSTAT
jgi:hypothetical protein